MRCEGGGQPGLQEAASDATLGHLFPLLCAFICQSGSWFTGTLQVGNQARFPTESLELTCILISELESTLLLLR